jgi:glutathione peroxidase
VAKTIYQFEAPTPSGPVTMDQYKGKVLLIVNTASRCGFTPQYEGLEAMYRKHKDRGFEVLGFPCNQFGAQEPGNDEEIRKFCSLNYDVSFPLFSKVDVNGDAALPLFKHLKEAAPGILGTQQIKWNFTKFLIDRDGHVVKRYAPQDKPEEIATEIDKLLG